MFSANICIWYPESSVVRVCSQASAPSSSFGLSACVKCSMKWAFIHVREERNNSLFAFSLCFHVFHCLYFFLWFLLLLVAWCSIVTAASPLWCSDMIKQPLELGQVACTKALDLLVYFFFCSEVELLNTWCFGLTPDIMILFAIFGLYLLHTKYVVISAFHEPTEIVI